MSSQWRKERYVESLAVANKFNDNINTEVLAFCGKKTAVLDYHQW